MSNIQIQLTSESAESLQSFKVRAKFYQKRPSASGNSGNGATSIPIELTALTDETGTTQLVLPDKGSLKGEVVLEIAKPDGEMLVTKRIPNQKVVEPLEIDIGPNLLPQLQSGPDGMFHQPEKLRGHIVTPKGAPIANQRIMLNGKKGANDNDTSQLLATFKTNEIGYFSVDYPAGIFTAVHCRVADNDPVAVPLEPNGTLPEMLKVIADFDVEAKPESESEEDECACDQETPHLPDELDMLHSRQSYVDDLGTGHCVSLTKPNRCLESFTYYKVVRTTEPEIRGLSLTKTKTMQLGEVMATLPGLNFSSAAQLQTFADDADRQEKSPNDGTKPQAAATDGLEPVSQAVARGVGIVKQSSASAKIRSLSKKELEQPIRLEAIKTLAEDPEAVNGERIIDAVQYTNQQNLWDFIDFAYYQVGGRSRLTCDNPVDWDDTPTFYQACTISHGHLLCFEQKWLADGYSLGDLLYSLPLAPCQKKYISILDWDRREGGYRSEFGSQQESLFNQTVHDRDVREVVNTALSERSSRGSQAQTRSSAKGGGFGIGGFFGSVLFGVGGAASKGGARSNSSAWQNSSRKLAASSLLEINERIQTAAQAVRSQRHTVIQSSHQHESVKATTEVIANHNHCHALTMQYFEVLRHFLIKQKLASVQECLFVPLFMSRFDLGKALRWRQALERVLMRRDLIKGFDALQRYANNYRGSSTPPKRFADQPLVSMQGHMRLKFRLVRPKDDPKRDYEDAPWKWLALLLGMSSQEFFDNYLAAEKLRDHRFVELLGPSIAAEIINGLRFKAVLHDGHQQQEIDLHLDTTQLSKFRNDTSLYVTIRSNTSFPKVTRDMIKAVRIDHQIKVDGGYKPIHAVLPASSQIIVESLHLDYLAPHSEHQLVTQERVLNDLTGSDDVYVAAPLSHEELKNPREEDLGLRKTLLQHLNRNLEYYHKWIWWQMSPDRRYMLLDGFIAPNSGGRSVASVVENRLIGIVGNCLIMPVAPGYHLDPTYKQDKENPVDLLEHYKPISPMPPSRIVLPTKGVHAEAITGSCNSCEKKDESRFWRWEESPCPDSPPAINPINGNLRGTSSLDLTPKTEPSQLINIQNGTPDRNGSGLINSTLGLLDSNALFNDLTGLDGNLKNVIEALKQAFSSAKDFGEQAAKLVLQKNVSKDIDKMLEKITKAKKDGLLTDEQVSKLVEKALNAMIGASDKKTEDTPKSDPKPDTQSSNETEPES